jgi:hypothetical protein
MEAIRAPTGLAESQEMFTFWQRKACLNAGSLGL